MSNPSYVKGRRKEYKIKKKLEEIGYIVTRASGSHSPFDLVAISNHTSLIRFIQAKPDNFSKKAKLRLQKEYEWMNRPFSVTFEVI